MLNAADLFCGAGGTSLGAEQAGARIRFALNHWQVAVNTHSANFPLAKHVNSRLDMCSPSECPKIDLLFASPECTHHSRARGGKPTSDQQRAGAWDVMKWVEHHRPSFLVIENVREFVEWGPIGDHGRPLEKFRGRFFQSWIAAIESAGYRVEFQILNAANFGAATSRERLFVIARKGTRAIHWPEPTHGKKVGGELPGMSLLPWRAASEVIDWSIELPSVFARKIPLRDKTLARIEAGLRRFVGPFAVTLRSTTGAMGTGGTSRDLNSPLGVVTAGGTHHGVAVPFVCGCGARDGQSPAKEVREPLNTIVTKDAKCVALPLVASTHFGGTYAPANQLPCPTIRCRNGALLAVPFMVPYRGERDGQKPRSHSAAEPLPTITTQPGGALCVPFLADVNHGGIDARVNSINTPIGVVTSKRGSAVVAPLVLSYYSNGKAMPTSNPLGTITTNDRFALMLTVASNADFSGRTDGERSLLATMRELGVLDIGFRMLANHELSAAQGFTDDYIFHGNKSEVTRQIGNSVSPPVAKAITQALAG